MPFVKKKKKQFPAKAQRRKEGRKGVEQLLVLRAFFAPLRLCASFFRIARFIAFHASSVRASREFDANLFDEEILR